MDHQDPGTGEDFSPLRVQAGKSPPQQDRPIQHEINLASMLQMAKAGRRAGRHVAISEPTAAPPKADENVTTSLQVSPAAARDASNRSNLRVRIGPCSL
jgi:hypothetical protein